MDFHRFTITLLVLRDDAPELTAEQEDALQDAHMSRLADLHQAGGEDLGEAARSSAGVSLTTPPPYSAPKHRPLGYPIVV